MFIRFLFPAVLVVLCKNVSKYNILLSKYWERKNDRFEMATSCIEYSHEKQRRATTAILDMFIFISLILEF